MPEKLKYREHAQGEVVVLSDDVNLIARVIRDMTPLNIYTQPLSPSRTTAPTLRNNAEKTLAAVIGPDVIGRKPDVVLRLIEECRTEGIKNITLLTEFKPGDAIPGLPFQTTAPELVADEQHTEPTLIEAQAATLSSVS